MSLKYLQVHEHKSPPQSFSPQPVLFAVCPAHLWVWYFDIFLFLHGSSSVQSTTPKLKSHPAPFFLNPRSLISCTSLLFQLVFCSLFFARQALKFQLFPAKVRPRRSSRHWSRQPCEEIIKPDNKIMGPVPARLRPERRKWWYAFYQNRVFR